jgi:hypothetical protein
MEPLAPSPADPSAELRQVEAALRALGAEFQRLWTLPSTREISNALCANVSQAARLAARHEALIEAARAAGDTLTVRLQDDCPRSHRTPSGGVMLPPARPVSTSLPPPTGSP